MPLPKWELAKADTAVCTLCGAENQVRVFPAILQLQPPGSQAEAATEGEAACFDHPAKRALAACRQCGRFVCGICAVDFAGETWCPSCIAAGAGAAREAKLETSRTLYDSVVLTLPLVSLIAWPFTIIAAPAALALGLLKWNQPLSLVRRNRWRLITGMLIALAEIVGWVWLVLYFINRAASTK
jgi:hypothetical protein